MELDEYLRASFRHRWLILGTALLAAAAGFISVTLQPISYDTSVALTIHRVNQPNTGDFQYDGYYAMQASDFVAQTIVSWLGTPALVQQIYQAAGFDPSIRSIEEVGRRFQPKKLSAQSVAVRFTDESRTVAEKLAGAVSTTISDRVAQLDLTVDGKPSFKTEAASPVIVERQPKPWFAGGIGLIAGALAGWFIAAAVEGVKRSEAN